MPFYGKLEYEKIKDKESFFGRPVYRLTHSFFYRRRLFEQSVYCDVGFETDFASIPEWIIFLNPRDGKWKKAAVIHDRACEMAKNKEMSYKEADLFFFDAMREDGASLFTAYFFYFWVRLNHLITLKG